MSYVRAPGDARAVDGMYIYTREGASAEKTVGEQVNGATRRGGGVRKNLADILLSRHPYKRVTSLRRYLEKRAVIIYFNKFSSMI